MRCPKAPGKGGFSNPGSSRLNLTHITIRGMIKTPGTSYHIFLTEYYKKQGLMSNMALSRATARGDPTIHGVTRAIARVAPTIHSLTRATARVAPTIHGCASPISSSGRATDLRFLEESRIARSPRVLFLGMQGRF